MKATALLIASFAGSVNAQSPVVALQNAAAPGQTMPWIGLGTGGYGTNRGAFGAYPECWMEIAGCGNYTIEAVKTYLALGGTRLDAADRCALICPSVSRIFPSVRVLLRV